MRFVVFCILPVLFLVLATCQNVHPQQILNANDDFSIPGSNPFTYCSDHRPYVMQISEMNFSLSKPLK